HRARPRDSHAVAVHDEKWPEQLVVKIPECALASDRARGQSHDNQQSDDWYCQRDEPERSVAASHFPIEGAPRLIEPKRRTINSQGKEMRRKQHQHESCVDDETQRSRLLRGAAIKG